MFRLISPRRLVLAGAAAAVTAGAAGGSVLATHLTATGNPTAAQSQAQTQSPSAGTHRQAKGKHHRDRHLDMVIGKVTAVSSNSISLADATGKVTSYTLSPRVKVFGPNHQPEQVTSLPVGEIVIAVAGDRLPDKGAAATTNGASQPGHDVVVRIRDTGFKAA